MNIENSSIIVDEEKNVTYLYRLNEKDKASVSSLDIRVKRNALMNLFDVVFDRDSSPDNLSISLSLEENSLCRVFLLNIGRNISRDIRTRLIGVNSRIEVKSIYILRDDNRFTLNVSQDHVTPLTYSNLLVKGVLKERSKMSFVGKIYVGRSAKDSSAQQTSKALLLNSGPEVENKPILEIENNSIERCSHSATVKNLDEEEMFYLETRGLNRTVVSKVLSIGFLEDILGEIPDYIPHLYPEIMEQIDTALGGGMIDV